MSDVVRLTAVSSQGEADVICGLLRTAGIECSDRSTGIWAGELGGGWGGWREILVAESDLALAREVLETVPPPES